MVHLRIGHVGGFGPNACWGIRPHLSPPANWNMRIDIDSGTCWVIGIHPCSNAKWVIRIVLCSNGLQGMNITASGVGRTKRLSLAW